MNTFNRPNTTALAFLLFSLCLLLPAAASFALSSPPTTNKQDNELALLRQAGIQGDRSQIPALLAGLKNPSHRFYKHTALHSLAQMGATEALPQITAMIARAQSPETHDAGMARFATASKARLLAEHDAQGIPDSRTRITTKISRFLSEIGLPVTDINAAAADYHKRGGEVQTWQEPPLGVYALREIADMLYQEPFVDAADLVLVSGLDFADDPPSALKLRLAPLSRPDRLRLLVQELASGKVLYGDQDDRYHMQLTADAGPAAGRAISAQLEKMDAHRSEYKGAGFSALFDAL